MKLSIIALAFFLGTAAVASNQKPNYEEIDAAIVFAIFDKYGQSTLSTDILNTLPNKIVCGPNNSKTTLDGLQSSKPSNGEFSSGIKITSDPDVTAILFDGSEGDQYDGILVLKADLNALKSGQVSIVPAKSYNGFNHGPDYILLSNTSCSLN